MSQQYLTTSVFEESVNRLKTLYEDGHRVVVSFSGGKDSTVCLELALIAAKETKRLPVEVVMRDEEIMFPGTFEFCERVYNRKDVDFRWLIANQPVINIFNRECPYFWVFDPLLPPEEWVRQPPKYAQYIKTLNIESIINAKTHPPAPGKNVVCVMGIRTRESPRRMRGICSAKGFITKEYSHMRRASPIYDWSSQDVWKAIHDNQWDYNQAYDTIFRLSLKTTKTGESIRIAPPTIAKASVRFLKIARKAWPQWFEKVCKRLPGIRAVSMFGVKTIQPFKPIDETWQHCYQRTCIDEAPAWIATRAESVMQQAQSMHRHHSPTPLPDSMRCPVCANPGCWRDLAQGMYMGNPWLLGGKWACFKIGYSEPEDFRPDSGRWGGKPSW